MQGSRQSFFLTLCFALLAIIAAPAIVAAQDMPPILAPPTAEATPAKQAPVPPSAEISALPAVRAPAAAAPAQARAAALAHARAAAPAHLRRLASAADRAALKHQSAKLATITKRLAAARTRIAALHAALRHPDPPLSPGTVVAPPGYFAPGPYERLVYGGSPRAPYGGWGRYGGRYYP
jgi:hypothetical protein